MTLHDPTPPRKPPAPRRPRRFWLYAPYVVLLIAMIGWSGAWLWVRAKVADEMDAAASRLRDRGYTIAWNARSIGGYPFRIDVTLDGLRVAEASGWGLMAPRIKVETYVYSLRQWIGYAPSGVVLSRPGVGAVTITGPALRASYAVTDQDAPRVAVEGLKLVFTPAPAAKPFVLGACRHLDFHLRPAQGDRAEFLLRIDGAAAATGGVLAAITQNQPLDLVWEAALTHVSSLHGKDWPSLARTWTASGGALESARGGLAAGATTVGLRPGALTIGDDGRLRGGLGLELKRAPDLIQILAAAKAIDPAAIDAARTVARAGAAKSGAATQVDLTFMAGVATFGPVAIGPAPRVY